MHSLFSTTLLIEGNEVAYTVYFEPTTSRYNFKPTSPEFGFFDCPCFWMHQLGSKWYFNGVANLSCEQQAIQQLSTYLGIKPLIVPSGEEVMLTQTLQKAHFLFENKRIDFELANLGMQGRYALINIMGSHKRFKALFNTSGHNFQIKIIPCLSIEKQDFDQQQFNCGEIDFLSWLHDAIQWVCFRYPIAR